MIQPKHQKALAINGEGFLMLAIDCYFAGSSIHWTEAAWLVALGA